MFEGLYFKNMILNMVEVQTDEKTEKPMKINELNLNDRIQNYVQSNRDIIIIWC